MQETLVCLWRRVYSDFCGRLVLAGDGYMAVWGSHQRLAPRPGSAPLSLYLHPPSLLPPTAAFPHTGRRCGLPTDGRLMEMKAAITGDVKA